MPEEMKCNAAFDAHVCERTVEHRGKHSDGGFHWTDGGKKMILERREKENQQK
jgi:hypothetical protein